jgi:ATP phosphoribosyltransferase
LNKGVEPAKISLFSPANPLFTRFGILFAFWRTAEKRALQAKDGKTQVELAFLKAQINPIFIQHA